MGHQPPPDPYDQPPQMPRKVVATSKHRGLSGMSHTRHLVLTIFTCGLWGLCVWLPWWMFRMVFRRKKKTVYRYR